MAQLPIGVDFGDLHKCPGCDCIQEVNVNTSCSKTDMGCESCSETYGVHEWIYCGNENN